MRPITTSIDVNQATVATAAAERYCAQLSAAGELAGMWRERERFVILNTDFGDGVHFLLTAAAWRDDVRGPQQLHYLALLAQPLSRQQLQAGLAPLETIATAAGELIAQWLPAVTGYHRLFLQQQRIVLTLIVGDPALTLPQIDAGIDAFCLTNAALSVLGAAQYLPRRLARLAAPQALLALDGGTADEQQAWRQALTPAGFIGDAALHPIRARFAPRWQHAAPRVTPQSARRAIVIGAGLAGSAICESLAVRGWQLDLIETHDGPAQEASGNLAGVYMPVISRDDNPAARLTRQAYLFAQQVWARIGGFAQLRGARCGVLQVARDPEQAAAFEQAARHWHYPDDYAQWLDAGQASARVGMRTGSGWYFPDGGWLNPASVCEAMLRACGTHLTRHFGQAATTLRRSDDQWQAVAADGRVLAQAPAVILANGMGALQFAQAQALPLTALRGQVTHIPATGLLATLPLALCGDGYLTPPSAGIVSLGASYDDDQDAALRVQSHLGNLHKLQQMLPGLRIAADATTLGGRVGFRCVAADRLPLVGALPDSETRQAVAADHHLASLPRLPGLHGLLGYASRGLIWAPLAAELLACQMEGEPLPMGRDLAALLDPARFALKAARKSDLS